MELNHLPIVDWTLAKKLAGNKESLAKEMIDYFVKTISDNLETIKESYHREKLEEFTKLVHKLHGGLCYCGLPRLKLVVERLESDLKKNIMVDLESLLAILDHEVMVLLNYYHTHHLIKQSLIKPSLIPGTIKGS